MPKKDITQNDLLIEFFKKNPNRDIKHPEVVDWVTEQWRKRVGSVFRDPDRQIRKLSQEGFLIKVGKGIYRYDPKFVKKVELEDFTTAQKKEILEKYYYKCAQCGIGKREGAELHIDHIIPKDWGGRAALENGQVLCSRCNFLKKNLKQTTSGKKMFINMYEMAKKENNKEMIQFCKEVLETYEKHSINGYITWKK